MIRSACLSALLLALAPLATQAQVHYTAYSFESLAGVMHNENRWVSITGTYEGETSPRTVAVYWTGGLRGRCEKLINLMLSEPGAYIFSLITRNEVFTGPSGQPETRDHLAGCGVHRKP